jgi:hypothetical protein
VARRPGQPRVGGSTVGRSELKTCNSPMIRLPCRGCTTGGWFNAMFVTVAST